MMEIISMPGPAAKEYIGSKVMPTVAEGLAKLLTDQPDDPVRQLTNFLQRNNPRRPPSNTYTVELPSGTVTFESRICAASAVNALNVPLPANFHKCGEYPVYGCSVPSRNALPSLFRHLSEIEHVSRVHCVLVGAAETLLYADDVALSAQPSAAILSRAKRECVAADVPPTAESVEQIVVEAVSEPLTAQLPRSGGGGSRAKANGFESPSAQALRSPNAPWLSITGEPSSGARRPPPPRVISIVGALREAAEAAEVLAPTVTRVQHPPNVPITSEFCDELVAVCDAALADGDSAVLILTCEKTALLKHAMAVATLFFRSRRDVQHIRRLLNALDQQAATFVKPDIDAHTRDLRARRARRDADRAALLQAHIASLVEREEEEPVEELIRRDEAAQRRRERRKKADSRRDEIALLEGSGAATRVQSFVRGVLTRRKNPLHRRVRETKEDFDELCREGHYPLVECALQVLIDQLGAEFITHETPKRGGTKQFKKWTVHMSRVPPTDDIDVSSEDEEWTCEVLERVSADVSVAFNPFQDTRAALDLAGADDISYMYSIHMHHANLPALQKKAMQVMERMVTYMMFSAYLSFRNKRIEAELTEHGSNAHQQLRVPASVQHCNSFAQFLELCHEPLEWFSNAAYALPLFSNMPQPVLAQRLLVAAPTASGAFIPAEVDQLRLDHAAAGTPIYFAPDCLTADQWTEAAATVLRTNAKARRVLWLSTRPDFSVFVNGVPFSLMQRFVTDPDDGQLPVFRTIRNAEVNLHQSTMPGGIADQSSGATRNCFGSGIFQTPLSPHYSMKSPSFAEHVDMKRAKEARRAKVEPSWFGLHYEPLEQELVTDLQAMIDADDNGRLAYTGVDRAVPDQAVDCDFAFSETRPTKLTLRHMKVVRPRRAELPHQGRQSGANTPVEHSSSASAILPPLPATPRSSGQSLAGLEAIGIQSSSVQSQSLVNNNTSNNMSGTTLGSRLIDPLTHGKRDGKLGARGGVSGGGGGVVGRHQTIKRQASVVSHGSVDEDLDLMPLPSKAAEALATPAQTAEMVKSRLRRVHGFDNALMYRRIPMLATNGTEWLSNIDALYASVHDAFADPSVFLVCTVASPESVFYGVMASLVWAVEYCKSGALGKSKTPSRQPSPMNSQHGGFVGGMSDGQPQSLRATPQASGGGQNSPMHGLNSRGSALSSSMLETERTGAAAVAGNGGSAGTAPLITEESGALPTLSTEAPEAELSRFPCVARLVRLLPRLDLQDSVQFVDQVLRQMGANRVLFDCIEDSMVAAAAATDPSVAEQLAVRATCALERYIVLLLFHAFLRVAQEQRSMMSVMQLSDGFSFKNFIATHQETIAPFLDTLDPWEGRGDIDCPVNPYSGATRGAHRWRRRVWMPNIN